MAGPGQLGSLWRGLSSPAVKPNRAAAACPSPFPASTLPKAEQQPPLPASAASPEQVVGKLRVRLSCLWPNSQHSASLPLLGERAKGAQVVGAVSLSMQASYASSVRAWFFTDLTWV